MTESKRPAAKNDSPSDKIWDFFCSLKLTIITLLLLAIVSIIGTILQQGQSMGDYVQERFHRMFPTGLPKDLAQADYHKLKEGFESTYHFFNTLNFFDMYHSWWFIGLLALFSVNLICCSIKNFPRAWKFFRDPTLIPSPGLLKNSANRLEASAKENPQQLRDRLVPLLKKEFSNPVQSEADGKLYLFAQKGIFSRLGAYLTHLSILIIMLGAIIGNLWGYKAFVAIEEGTTATKIWSRSSNQQIPLDFGVRCDNFNVSYYADGMRPKEYTSDLVIVDKGKEVLKHKLEVNEPLTYKGITFYQSSFGRSNNPFYEVRVKDKTTGKELNLTAHKGQRIQLPEGYSFTVVDSVVNDRIYGPAMRLRLDAPEPKDNMSFTIWQNYPKVNAKVNAPFTFNYTDHTQYTGLQIAKDPGVWIVWFGCFLMVFGSLTAFFVSHKRLWVCIDPSGGNTKVIVVANAHRNQPGFSLAFDELRQKLEATIENSPVKEG